MTDIEYQSMFALWCLVKAPLMLGADLRTITRLIMAVTMMMVTIWWYLAQWQRDVWTKKASILTQGEWGLQNHHQPWPFGRQPGSPWSAGEGIKYTLLMFCLASGWVREGLLQSRTYRRADQPPDLLSLCQLLAGNHHLPEPGVIGGDGDIANLWQIATMPLCLWLR